MGIGSLVARIGQSVAVKENLVPEDADRDQESSSAITDSEATGRRNRWEVDADLCFVSKTENITL